MPEMRVPVSWLKEFVEIDMPLSELAERMTLAGLEVNEIEQIGADWDRDLVVVGQIVEVRPHPNADSLTVPVVDYGGEEPLAIVTGAPNIKVGDSGQKVVFAKSGARLIDGHSEERKYIKLKPTKIRGVRSEGMVCSEKELDISDAHTGIIILPDDAPVGMPLQDYLGEHVLNIEIIPNIARCLSIVGVAREVAVLTGKPLKLDMPTWVAEGEPIADKIEIEIADTDLCARYSAGLIRDIKIGPSPLRMKMRLAASGMRPISNIVDITNYVMLEWGQPLHAFDYDTLTGRGGQTPPDESPTIIVRRARPGETMTTLDKVARKLDEEMLLITDGSGPIALAGVMGGLETEVTGETTSILLESANFDGINNRRTSQLLNLPSEASVRFGRGIDPERTVPALKRAAELMRTLAGGTICQGIADNYAVKPPERVIALPPSEVERLVGVKLPTSQIIDILQSLGFGCELPQPDGAIQVRVPSHRLDVSLKADLVEEVARIYGSDNIPLTLMNDPMPPQRNNPLLANREKARDILAGTGLQEIICYSTLGEQDQANLLAPYADKPFATPLEPGAQHQVPCVFAAQDCITLANPLSPEHQYMRTTLLPSMLMTLEKNLRNQAKVALFEIGNVYLPRQGQTLPDEPNHLCIGLSGPRTLPWWAKAESTEMSDLFDLKGIVEALLDRLGVHDVAYRPANSEIFQPGRVAEIVVSDTVVGVMGEIHPLVREAFDLPTQRINALEIDLERLLAERDEAQLYSPISRFPLVSQDLALVVDEDIPAAQVAHFIRQAGGEAIASVRLFDVYQGEPIPAGKKSLAYSISFQDMERTLTDKAVRRIRGKIQSLLEREINAQVRS